MVFLPARKTKLFRCDCSEARVSGAGRFSAEGFTLVELIMIIVLIGILAVVATVRSANLGGARCRVAANQVKRDLRYAQHLAGAQQVTTWVVFDASDDEYSLYTEEAGASRAPMTHPLTRGDYVIHLNEGEFAGVEIIDVDFNGKSEVSFDSMGTPLDTRRNPLSADGTVSLSDSIDITVSKDTGLVKVMR